MKIITANSDKGILKLSHAEWIKIGHKTGWLKLSGNDIIEVDGKWYKEDDSGNLVETSDPNKKEEPKKVEILEPKEELKVEPEVEINPEKNPEQSAKSKSFPKLGVTFIEGQEYENWYGRYRILEILDDKMMKIEYLESFKGIVSAGEIKTYPMLAQAETISKAKMRSEADLARQLNLGAIINFKGTDDFFTLGYMAKHGYISAEIGPKYHKSFPYNFQKITGELPDKYLDKGYALSTNDDRWSYTLRMKIPNPDPEIGNKLKLPDNNIVRKSGIEINDCSYVWNLFRNGFRPGRNEDRAEIISTSIPADAKDIFMAGFNS